MGEREERAERATTREPGGPADSGPLLDDGRGRIESDRAVLLPLDGRDCIVKRIEPLLDDIERVRIDELRPLDVVEQRLDSLHDTVSAVEWEQGRPVGFDTSASVVE